MEKLWKLRKVKIKIRLLPKLIGKIVATFPASLHARLHYRMLDRFKIKMLKINNDNWNAKIKLSDSCLSELIWWKNNVSTFELERSLYIPQPNLELYCDASGLAWGSYLNGIEAKAPFAENQLHLSINSKELLAVLYGIQSHLDKLKNSTFIVFSDNFTTVCTLKKMSSSDKLHDKVVRKIYKLAFEHNMSISVSFIKGKNNFFADKASRTAFKSETSQ